MGPEVQSPLDLSGFFYMKDHFIFLAGQRDNTTEIDNKAFFALELRDDLVSWVPRRDILDDPDGIYRLEGTVY